MAYRRSPLMQKRLAENRQRIVAATRELIAEGGFRKASVAAVAASAGLSAGAVYRYFPSKAGLFVEVLTDAVDRECAILKTIIAQPGTATQRLRGAVESFSRRALAGPRLAYAFMAEPVDPEIESARLACRRQFSNVFKTVLRSGIAAGEFPKQSVDIGAACIVGAFTEALVRPAATGGTRVAKQRMVAEIVAFCCRAIVGNDRVLRE